MPYRLRTFGGLDLRHSEDERCEAMLSQSKGMALLVYLVVEGPERGVARSKLAATLWPGRREALAQNALRSTLTRIRQAADESPIEGKGESLLTPARDRLEADVWAFRRALERGDTERALELYRGDFLAGFRIDDAAPFERWIDERRERFRDRAYEAAVTTGRRTLEQGQLEDAEAAYRRSVELRPLREEGAGGLVRTLARGGRTAEAIRRFEAFRERRERELDLAPSEDLRDLVRKIRDGTLEQEVDDTGSPIEPSGTGRPESTDGEGPPTRVRPGEAPGEDRESPSPGGGDGPDPARPARRSSRSATLAILGLLVAAAGAAWFLLGTGGATPDAGDRSIAVLPFQPVGGGESGAFAEGMHADLLTRLAHFEELDVIAQTSVERYRRSEATTAEIARELGVRWVLEGTVQQAGDRLQVNAQLIDPRTGTHVWAANYRRELTAERLFELQGEIIRQIARALEARVGDARERPETGSLQAHGFYIRGRSLLEQREPDGMRRALGYFEQALQQDSSYALAWAGIADALSILSHRDRGGTDADTVLPRAREAARRALEIAPDLAEGHVARGRIRMYRRDGPAALRDFRRAIESKPGLAAAHAWMAKLRLSLGHAREALDPAERSVKLNPLSDENLATLCWVLLANDRPERALEVVDRIVELRNPGGSAPLYRVMALAHLGRREELERTIEEWGVPEQVIPFAATLEAATGNPAEAERLLAEAGPDTPLLTSLALHSTLGQLDRAFELLREAYPREERLWDIDLTIVVRYFFPATFRPLREDPRFEDYLREVRAHWGLAPDGSLPEG